MDNKIRLDKYGMEREEYQYENNGLLKRTETSWFQVIIIIAYPVYFVYSETHNIFYTLLIPGIILFIVLAQVDSIYFTKNFINKRRNKTNANTNTNFLLSLEEEKIIAKGDDN